MIGTSRRAYTPSSWLMRSRSTSSNSSAFSAEYTDPAWRLPTPPRPVEWMFGPLDRERDLLCVVMLPIPPRPDFCCKGSQQGTSQRASRLDRHRQIALTRILEESWLFWITFRSYSALLAAASDRMVAVSSVLPAGT